MVPKRPAARAPQGFEIWQAGGRIHSIDSPVRIKVLRHLEKGPRTLKGLAAATRKSKPTLSQLHMPPLLQGGLVTAKPDPRDRRVKWYVLVGNRLGSSAVGVERLRDAVLGYVQARAIVPLRPILDVLALDDLLRQAARPYADAVAARLGALVGRMLVSPGGPARAEELDRLLASEGLGRVAMRGGRPAAEAADPRAQAFLARLAEAALGARGPSPP